MAPKHNTNIQTSYTHTSHTCYNSKLATASRITLTSADPAYKPRATTKYQSVQNDSHIVTFVPLKGDAHEHHVMGTVDSVPIDLHAELTKLLSNGNDDIDTSTDTDETNTNTNKPHSDELWNRQTKYIYKYNTMLDTIQFIFIYLFIGDLRTRNSNTYDPCLIQLIDNFIHFIYLFFYSFFMLFLQTEIRRRTAIQNTIRTLFMNEKWMCHIIVFRFLLQPTNPYGIQKQKKNE